MEICRIVHSFVLVQLPKMNCFRTLKSSFSSRLRYEVLNHWLNRYHITVLWTISIHFIEHDNQNHPDVFACFPLVYVIRWVKRPVTREHVTWVACTDFMRTWSSDHRLLGMHTYDIGRVHSHEMSSFASLSIIATEQTEAWPGVGEQRDALKERNWPGRHFSHTGRVSSRIHVCPYKQEHLFTNFE